MVVQSSDTSKVVPVPRTMSRRQWRSSSQRRMMIAKNLTGSSDNQVDPLTSPRVEWVPIGALRLNPRNARTHSKKQIKRIAASIRKFGFLNPVLVDEANLVLAGHGRLGGARLEGLSHVPVVRFDHLTAAQKRAFLIADNKIAEDAGWDREML